jgi:predicted  nucleic acid-binding Zn-ribbon protein
MIVVAETGELTLRVLREIRDELVGTNQRVDRLREDTTREIGQLRTETTRRLDHLAEGQVRLATEVAGLRGEVGELRGEVGELRGEVGGLRGEVRRQGDRLENALLTGGQALQGLRQRIERLEEHTGLEPA